MHQAGQLLLWVLSSVPYSHSAHYYASLLPPCLICPSLTTVASFPLSPVHSFLFPGITALLFSLYPPLSLLASDYLAPCFLHPPPLVLYCSTSSICLSLSLFPSSFPSSLTLYPSASQCSSVWIAGMLFTEVSIVTGHLNKSARCKLERGHVISPWHTGRPTTLNQRNYWLGSEPLPIF